MMTRRAFVAASGVAAQAAVTWPPVEPRAAGFDPSQLETARRSLQAHATKSLLILRGGRLVLEWYAEGMTATTKHYTASMAKALVGGVSLLVAMNDGRIRPNDLASKYIPGWRDDPRKSKIMIRHLATHTSGIEDSSVEGVAHNQEPGWKGRFWRREPDPFRISIAEAPVLFEPGAGNQYSNPGMACLAYAVTASLRGAPQSDIRTLLRDRVFAPMGLADDEWSIGYGQAYRVDGMDLYANWGGGGFTARATGRAGEWMLHEGAWAGKALVEPRWVRQAVRYGGMPVPDRVKEPHAPGSGLAWYTNFDGVWRSVPRDAFAGAGAGHQVLLVVPSLDLVVVRNGGALREGEYWAAIDELLFEPLMRALGYPAKPLDPPYPRSPVIRSVTFAPAASVVRQAVDSDNWPITWGDDGELYTAYGDGGGFEPKVAQKLSLGFARVSGGRADFRGVNIRSGTGERTGDGAAGAKASGMLMVGGVLYAWVRNVGNAQLLWSRDRARTWEWGFKFDHGFGSPAFLNFGRNYAGATDDFVYAYSQQGLSAYEVNDGVVLARAPRGHVRERAAWRFYSRVDPGEAQWSANIQEARPVLQYPGHCQRVDAVYHAATKRYLLVIGYGHNGGWGIYDAPRPWGPWSVAFHTEYWGLGETHGYRIPSKWISEDGRTAGLVFSGLVYGGVVYDAFCVREMRLEF